MLRRFVLISLLCASSIGQGGPAGKSKQPRPIPTLEVKFEPDPKLSIPFEEHDDPAVFSEGCDVGGRPYVRVDRLLPPRSTEVLKFDPKGVVTFETNKISDIVEPKWIGDFISGSELYMLVEGDTRTEQHTRKMGDGRDAVSWDTRGEPRYYIAKFDTDGSYKGALKLDLPFRPTRLSGFMSGGFLTTGSDENNLLRVALLDSGGQLLRYIEFPKEKRESAEKTISGSSGLAASPELASMMLSGLASFFPYQGNVLYVRGRSGAPIYEISAGGEARALKVKAPDGYTVEYILPSDRNWFVVSAEQGQYVNAKSVVYEVDPSSGELLVRYLADGAGRAKLPSEGQSDLACFYEGEFISVRHQDGKLTVLHGTPAPGFDPLLPSP
jgi:hypothetical protein